MPPQPANKIIDETVRVGLELEGVIGAGVLDDLFIRGGEAVDELARARVRDDAVLLRQHQQDRQAHVLRNETQVTVEADALDEKPGRGVAQSKFIFTDKTLP